EHQNPEKSKKGHNFLDKMNPDSLKTITAKLEPSLQELEPGTKVQFERNGYFCVDTVDSQPGKPVFNRTVTLKDSWAKMQSKGKTN
ncbi:MAG: glutamine--tRNA ligase, partial [Pirellulaceae bacterium]